MSVSCTSVFAARIVWLQRGVFRACFGYVRFLDDLQTGLADKGEDWLRKELASLNLGPLRVVAGELGLSRGGSKAELAAAIGNEICFRILQHSRIELFAFFVSPWQRVLRICP